MSQRARISLLASAAALILLLGLLVAADRTASTAARSLTGPPARPDTDPVAEVTPPDVPDAGETAGAAIPVAVEEGTEEPVVDAGPVEAVRAAVVVDVDAASESVASGLLDQLDGVTHVAAITVVPTTLGGVEADVAAIDVEQFRPFTPPATAGHVPLWERVLAGDVAVTHEFGTVHEVPLGSQLASGVLLPTGEPVSLRVGAFATNGTPPVADAIVAAGTLPTDTPGARRLLVALQPEASPVAVVEALADEGISAEEIPDPRLPRSDTVVPVEGITPENVWDHLAMCESSGDWHINTGNGYYGGVQFLPESWWMVGGEGLPHEATREEQIHRATLLWQIQGWEAWPQCARKLGLIVDPPPEPEPSDPPQPVATEPG